MCRLKLRCIIFIVFFYALWFGQAYAWNAEGHRLVAQIAYDNMTEEARRKFDAYIQAIDNSSFVEAAVWLDRQRSAKMLWLKPLHYMDIPFSTDGTPTTEPQSANAVYALKKAKAVLEDPDAPLSEKALSARILIHVLADIHQPMHAVSRFNRRNPKGDKGGNLFFLKGKGIPPNLHAYWDSAGGWLQNKARTKKGRKAKKGRGYYYQNYLPILRQFSGLANRLEQEYPCDTESLAFAPQKWAEESWHIAVTKAYSIRMRQRPSQAYQQMVKNISQERIALAGCRLAALLNHCL